jgi:hypothetical protein
MVIGCHFIVKFKNAPQSFDRRKLGDDAIGCHRLPHLRTWPYRPKRLTVMQSQCKPRRGICRLSRLLRRMPSMIATYQLCVARARWYVAIKKAKSMPRADVKFSMSHYVMETSAPVADSGSFNKLISTRESWANSDATFRRLALLKKQCSSSACC